VGFFFLASNHTRFALDPLATILFPTTATYLPLYFEKSIATKNRFFTSTRLDAVDDSPAKNPSFDRQFIATRVELTALQSGYQ
jgi:hypothetical protein